IDGDRRRLARTLPAVVRNRTHGTPTGLRAGFCLSDSALFLVRPAENTLKTPGKPKIQPKNPPKRPRDSVNHRQANSSPTGC
ncbi:MAG: hypothetical protein KBA32_06795, partial [Propionivibrio sp.]|uniref:hypothetical protein n=1 Tax=Propionivibrio sp. TaxID=2212460 RepID=UPI001B675178